jgi:CRISPR-associated protein Cas1
MEALNKQNYYKIWHELCSYYSFYFEYRSYKPPHNELNSIMSFMYGLIYKDIIQSIYKQGLDPRLSFNHAINNRRNSALEYDISDYIKPILVDRLIFRLIRSKKIQIHDFDPKTGSV